jgi:hypothetical protein
MSRRGPLPALMVLVVGVTSGEHLLCPLALARKVLIAEQDTTSTLLCGKMSGPGR